MRERKERGGGHTATKPNLQPTTKEISEGPEEAELKYFIIIGC